MYRPNAHHDDSRAILAEIKREANGYDPRGWPYDATPEEMEAERIAQTPRHYHVWNQYGDEPIATTTSLKEANKAAAEEARVWRDDIGAHVTGNAREGYTIQWERDSMGSWILYTSECPAGQRCDHWEEFSDPDHMYL